MDIFINILLEYKYIFYLIITFIKSILNLKQTFIFRGLSNYSLEDAIRSFESHIWHPEGPKMSITGPHNGKE